MFGPGQMGGPGFGGPMGPPPHPMHRNGGCGCCLLPFVIVFAVAALIIVGLIVIL